MALPMKRTSRPAVTSGPNKILIALAAAWIILSLAIGGAVSADTQAQSDPDPIVSSSTET